MKDISVFTTNRDIENSISKEKKLNTYKKFETPSDIEKWVNPVYSKTELLETDVKHTNIQALTEYKGGLYRVMNA